MQENNFDKKIREQLERREINPSLNSWDKLNAQLDDKETKSTKKYWWLGIAASFLAGILLTSLVFNDSYVKVTPKVVNGNSSEEIKMTNQIHHHKQTLKINNPHHNKSKLARNN